MGPWREAGRRVATAANPTVSPAGYLDGDMDSKGRRLLAIGGCRTPGHFWAAAALCGAGAGPPPSCLCFLSRLAGPFSSLLISSLSLSSPCC